jgi:ubiquinone/menaquinone biosynthesis C-methylase UbiE
MNRGHSDLTDWGLAHVSIKESDTILDVGCGGGRTVSKLTARASQGKVCGIDYSPESVAASGKTNARWIAMGRVEIRQGSVSQLPFPDGAFDLVTAVETMYFWPDLDADMREVFRVLKPGGSFILIAEVYKGGRKMAEKLSEKYIGMKILSVEEHRELFTRTGYAEIQVIEEREKEWICCVGRKPSTHGTKPE